jgi:hypothetical protein
MVRANLACDWMPVLPTLLKGDVWQLEHLLPV